MLDEILMATLMLAAIALGIALALNHAAQKLPADASSVVENIVNLLPQTQCGQCGYPGCRPYAEAIAAGEAVNLCPPGGQETTDKLVETLGRPPAFLGTTGDSITGDSTTGDSTTGDSTARDSTAGDRTTSDSDSIVSDPQPKVAGIIESECIGCGFCKEACPVDAIMGAVQHMHTVIASECTGCDLCLEPCPVDCIRMEIIGTAST